MIESIAAVAETIEGAEALEASPEFEGTISKAEADSKLENMLRENSEYDKIGNAQNTGDIESFNPDKTLESWLSGNKLDTYGLNLEGDVSRQQGVLTSKIENAQNELTNTDKAFIKDCSSEEMISPKVRLPESHGHFEGKPGDSKFVPDSEYVPPEKSRNPDRPYSNPDNLSFGEILKKYGIDGIDFKNGFPDFSEISRGTVKIEGFETGGSDAMKNNFDKADMALAEARGCTPEEVRAWRKENGYTWHECEDKETMQKVPHEVHANVPHDGGRSQH